jgi:hypothetical protein
MAERELVEGEAWIEQHRKGSDAQLASLVPSPDVRLRRTRPIKQHLQITGPRGMGRLNPM